LKPVKFSTNAKAKSKEKIEPRWLRSLLRPAGRHGVGRTGSQLPCRPLPGSTRAAGRTDPDRLLRCCVLNHLKGWSFREVERELRSNLVYRRFTHFDAEATPDFTSFSRLFALLGPSVTEKAVAQA